MHTNKKIYLLIALTTSSAVQSFSWQDLQAEFTRITNNFFNYSSAPQTNHHQPAQGATQPRSAHAAEPAAEHDLVDQWVYSSLRDLPHDAAKECTRSIKASMDNAHTEYPLDIILPGLVDCVQRHAHQIAYDTLHNQQAAEEVARSMEQNASAQLRKNHLDNNLKRWITYGLNDAIENKKREIRSHNTQPATDPYRTNSQPAR